MAGVADKFIRLIRRIVGLPEEPGEPPDLMRLGFYPAVVEACASDGSTCDVRPDDKRISPEQGVTVRVGIPGAVATVEVGSSVLLGWERGNPKSPFCMPAWAGELRSLQITNSAGATLSISSAGAVSVSAAPGQSVNVTPGVGGFVVLDNGTLPVARVNDPTQGHVHSFSLTAGPYAVSGAIASATDKIQSGNNNVLG